MKKILFVVVLVCFIMMFTLASASISQEISGSHIHSFFIQLNDNTVNLPNSLVVIEDEAFEGTSFTHIILPEKLTTIGEHAFANIMTLKTVRIPYTTNSIAKTAFAGSVNVKIIAAPNSYARTWAKENGIPFSPLAVIYAGTGSQSVTGSLSFVSKDVLDTELSETKDVNRTWRKFEEIHVNNPIEIIANVVQGRAPPMV